MGRVILGGLPEAACISLGGSSKGALEEEGLVLAPDLLVHR